MKNSITILLAIVVIAASLYVVAMSAWFDLNPCPAGTRVVETVWTDTATGKTSVSGICVQGEE